MTQQVAAPKKTPLKERFVRTFKRDWQYYLLCLPAILFTLIFSYGPMYGIQIAFKDFRAVDGIWGSPWVGLKHFLRFFSSPSFVQIVKNTIYISFYSLIAGFPLPIIIALMLNHVPSMRFKKIVQTTIYAPHFISMVVMCGMIILFLSPRTGIINHLIHLFGGERIYFLAKPEYFRHIYVWTGVWQGTGWGTIIYVAALSSVNPELYEAAKIDGASKFDLIRHIDLPTIQPTIVMLLILNLGSFMGVGFQKAFLLQNDLNHATSEIISTYVYKVGLLNSQFSFSTAVSLFNSAINIVLLLTTNWVSKRLSDTSLF